MYLNNHFQHVLVCRKTIFRVKFLQRYQEISVKHDTCLVETELLLHVSACV